MARLILAQHTCLDLANKLMGTTERCLQHSASGASSMVFLKASVQVGRGASQGNRVSLGRFRRCQAVLDAQFGAELAELMAAGRGARP